MKTLIRILRLAFYGTIAFVGGALVALSLVCLLESRLSPFELEYHTIDETRVLGILAFGTVWFLVCTRYMDRSRSFLSNAWVGSIGISLMPMLFLILDWDSLDGIEIAIFLTVALSGFLLFGLSIRTLQKTSRYSVRLQSVDSGTAHHAETRNVTIRPDASNRSPWAMSRKRKRQIMTWFPLGSAVVVGLCFYATGFGVALEGIAGAIMAGAKGGFYGGLVGFLLISLILYFVPDK